MDIANKNSAHELTSSFPSSLSKPSFFKRIGYFICPINPDERKKFFPTLLIFFVLAFIYDMLRILKSSLVVAESNVGAEIIPYLKVWALIPGAILLTGFAIKLSNYFDREKIIYIMISFFIAFYLLFMTLIYPNREALELVSLARRLAPLLPEGAKGFISMVQHWHLAVFYVVTELWGSILLSMLFWGFANEITKIEQAARFYPLFLLGANSAAIFAGLTSSYYAGHSFNPHLPFGHSAWEQSLVLYLLTAVVGGLLVMALFAWMQWQGINQPSSEQGEKASALERQKESVSLSIKECFVCLARSKHLLYIALLVLSYNLVFNLSDVLWENQLKLRYLSDTSRMASYKSHITTLTGVLSVFISLFISGNLLRRLGWKYAAYATPVVVGGTCVVFFTALIFADASWFSSLLLAFGSDPIHLSLLLGSMQVGISRGCKYTLFDTSKEIAFIPLSIQEKRLGKAAIDGVGSRLGKSAGSIFVQILLVSFSSIAGATPYMAACILLMLGVWCYAVRGLGKSLG